MFAESQSVSGRSVAVKVWNVRVCKVNSFSSVLSMWFDVIGILIQHFGYSRKTVRFPDVSRSSHVPSMPARSRSDPICCKIQVVPDLLSFFLVHSFAFGARSPSCTFRMLKLVASIQINGVLSLRFVWKKDDLVRNMRVKIVISLCSCIMLTNCSSVSQTLMLDAEKGGYILMDTHFRF